MPIHLSCVVEGHGDVEAVPIILRRIAADINLRCEIHIPSPIRTPKSKLLKAGELERAVELAARKIGGDGAVLVTLDSDDDCPARSGPTLLARAEAVRRDLPIAVILAKREFESWFLAAAESLAGQHGFPDQLQPPTAPEDVQGAKEWLTRQMQGRRTYSPSVDQPIFARSFDLQMARRARSFEKFYREVKRLLLHLCPPDG